MQSVFHHQQQQQHTLLDLMPAPAPSFWSLMMSVSITMNSSICRGLQRLLKGLRQYVFPSTSATSEIEVNYTFIIFLFVITVHSQNMYTNSTNSTAPCNFYFLNKSYLQGSVGFSSCESSLQIKVDWVNLASTSFISALKFQPTMFLRNRAFSHAVTVVSCHEDTVTSFSCDGTESLPVHFLWCDAQ